MAQTAEWSMGPIVPRHKKFRRRIGVRVPLYCLFVCPQFVSFVTHPLLLRNSSFDILSRAEISRRREMWGYPKTEEEVATVFVAFLKGKVMSIPWISADDVAPETHRMIHDLVRINQYGFFSINSQPAVNGVPSTDPDVGWGTLDFQNSVLQRCGHSR